MITSIVSLNKLTTSFSTTTISQPFGLILIILNPTSLENEILLNSPSSLISLLLLKSENILVILLYIESMIYKCSICKGLIQINKN